MTFPAAMRTFIETGDHSLMRRVRRGVRAFQQIETRFRRAGAAGAGAALVEAL